MPARPTTPNFAKPFDCQFCPGFPQKISTGFAPPDSPQKLEAGKIRFAILAEALGSTEALTGIPLSGSTGKALETEVLHNFGLTYDDILRDNVIRCQPRNNVFPEGLLGDKMVACCRQWDTLLDLYSPTVVIFCYHFTFSLIRTPSARFSAYNAVRKALEFHCEGERPLIASGEKSLNLLFPQLPGKISKWDGKHFFVNWTSSPEALNPTQFLAAREKRKAEKAPSLLDLLRKRKET
jgi:hypothetical protein